MKRILNLTQHQATPAQVAAGVVEPSDKAHVQALLTFNTLEDTYHMRERALRLVGVTLGVDCDAVMVGGAPFFMPTLVAVMQEHDVKVVFAFSVRESVEVTNPDGTVTKRSSFSHAGWVEG